MKILVANLGSTSFKYRLFDLPGEDQLARGGIDRIGESQSRCFFESADHRGESLRHVADHAAAVEACLEQLTHSETGVLDAASDVAAIGFKAVFAGRLSGVRLVDDELLAAMQELSDVAPAHNPLYVTAMRRMREAFPNIPLVAALDTGFHETIPPENRLYAVPYEWQERFQIQRWGFHGASHRYIAGRIAELLGRTDLRVISCHLGGSSSLCALHRGRSMANSLGMSPQTGLPHNNRVGDFDPFALPVLLRCTGKSLDELLDDLAAHSGLLGLSGISGDIRDLESAAERSDRRARQALDVFIASIRHYLGAYLALIGGADAIVFTGGIGENSRHIRQESCRKMEWAGIRLDPTRNDRAEGESRISDDESVTEIWVVPTNEELVVARQAAELIGEMP